MDKAEKRVRILLIEPFGHRGGHYSSYPRYLIQALITANVDVSVVSFQGFLDWPVKDIRVRHITFFSGSFILAHLIRVLQRILYIVKPLRALIPFLETFLTLFLGAWQSRRQNYDVIHILDASILPLSFLIFASIAKSRAFVCTLSNPPIELYLVNRPKNFKELLKNWEYIVAKFDKSKLIIAIKSFLYQRITRRSHIAFICHSKQVQKSYAKSIFYDKLKCIPWGMEKLHKQTLTRYDARKYLGLPQNEKILLSFGINHPRKNFEVIFQAIQNLPKNFKLLFVGQVLHGVKQDDPEELARKYCWLENTIVVNKHIPDEEIPYYFYAADAILLSYRKNFIGASGTLSLACSFNLPVIASDVGQLGEFVRNYKLGLTFSPDDPQSLREAILSFLNLTEEEKQEIKRKLAQFASTYSWEQVAKEHLKLYQSLLEEGY
jgi:glycosyltransferase involved in cell wall biosynthesis